MGMSYQKAYKYLLQVELQMVRHFLESRGSRRNHQTRGVLVPWRRSECYVLAGSKQSVTARMEVGSASDVISLEAARLVHGVTLYIHATVDTTSTYQSLNPLISDVCVAAVNQ